MVSRDYYNYIKELDLANKKCEIYGVNASEFRTHKVFTRLKHGLNYDEEVRKQKSWFDVLFVELPTGNQKKTLVVVQCIPEEIIDQTYPKQNWKKYRAALAYILTQHRITFTELRTTRRKEVLNKCENSEYELLELSDGRILKLWETPIFMYAETDRDLDLIRNISLMGCWFHETYFFYIIGCLK